MAKKDITEARQSLLMLAYLCIKPYKDEVLTIVDKVKVLDKFQLADDDIALLCDCKNQAVRDARQRIKKAHK